MTGVQTCALPISTCVYDVRAGKSLGKIGSVNLPASGPTVRIFALLDAPAKPPVVAAAPTAARGTASKLTITLPNAAGRILRS